MLLSILALRPGISRKKRWIDGERHSVFIEAKGLLPKKILPLEIILFQRAVRNQNLSMQQDKTNEKKIETNIPYSSSCEELHARG